MKQIIFMIILCLAAAPGKAQVDNHRISFATTVGSGLDFSTPSSTPFNWQVLGYYHLSNRWALGAGTGLSFYEKMLIPVYGDVKYQLTKERLFTPYVECALGYSFAPANHTNGGAFLNPSIGLQYRLRNQMKLQLAIGYELQKLERLKQHTNSYFAKEFAEELSHSLLSIKIGLAF